ncbi:MAG: Smr/MutS family protein [Pseudomonadota bacterium]
MTKPPNGPPKGTQPPGRGAPSSDADGRPPQRHVEGKPAPHDLWQQVTDTVTPLNGHKARKRVPMVPMITTAPPPPSPSDKGSSGSVRSQGSPVDLSPLRQIDRVGKTPGAQVKAELAEQPGRRHSSNPAMKPGQTAPTAAPDWNVRGLQTAGVDRRTAGKLARGQMTIDARLDLHGDRQHQAQDRLHHFIIASHRAGHRCLLVITGKGKRPVKPHSSALSSEDHGPGVIKRKLVEWLGAPALKPLILAVKTAQPKDGGEGAFYVLLRRHR